MCVIARQTLKPGMTDADWASDLKASLARQGYQWAGPDALTRAMRAVETAHGRPEAETPTETPEPPQPPIVSRAEAKRLYDEWHAPPTDDLLALAREAVVMYPGTDWKRCHVQLKAMETAAFSASIPFTWGTLSVALIKAQRELVLESRKVSA